MIDHSAGKRDRDQTPPPMRMLDGPKGREPCWASEASCKSERAKRVSGLC